MGTRIAILRAGRVVQFDRPEAILAHPADPFVEAFVGRDRALKRLSLTTVRDHVVPGSAPDNAPRIDGRSDLRDALSLLLDADSEVATVVSDDGTSQGVITLAAIRDALSTPSAS